VAVDNIHRCQEKGLVILTDSEGCDTKAGRRVGIDQFTVAGVRRAEKIPDMQLFTGIKGTGDFLVHHLEKILDPEPVIHEQAFLLLFFLAKAAAFEVIDNVFNDKDKGLPLGPGKIKNSGFKTVQVQVDIGKQIDGIAGKKGLSVGKDQIPFFIEVLALDQCVYDKRETADQPVRAILIYISLLSVQVWEKVHQERI